MSKEPNGSGRVTALNPEIFDTRVTPPPPGMEVQYFTVGGSLVRGVVSKDNIHMCMGWMPFPRMPDWLKQRIKENYVK